MEPEFDKVIDALMRSSPLNGGAANRASEPHLDADEIAAFAENLVPAAARQTYILHFADCGRCRSILSDVIALNADAVNASAPITSAATAAAPVIETVTPWYKRLFAMPNLAYGMGGLILVFSGLIGYTVLNNMSSDGGMVSQTSERAMPAYQTANTNVAASSANAANAVSEAPSVLESVPSANSTANAPTRREYGFEPTKTPEAGTYTQRLNESSDRTAATDTMPPPPPAPPAAAAPMIEARPMKDGEAKSAAEPESADELARQAPMLSRNKDAAKRKSEEAPKVSSAAPGGGAKRSVGGKSFEQRNGVWYDSAYDGRSTTNVRRGTQEYRNLDSGLRSIADGLRGPVIMVWKSTAYRID